MLPIVDISDPIWLHWDIFSSSAKKWAKQLQDIEAELHKWGFDYEYIYENKNLKFPNSTLISEHLTSNPNNGPIKKFIL